MLPAPARRIECTGSPMRLVPNRSYSSLQNAAQLAVCGSPVSCSVGLMSQLTGGLIHRAVRKRPAGGMCLSYAVLSDASIFSTASFPVTPVPWQSQSPGQTPLRLSSHRCHNRRSPVSSRLSNTVLHSIADSFQSPFRRQTGACAVYARKIRHSSPHAGERAISAARILWPVRPALRA